MEPAKPASGPAGDSTLDRDLDRIAAYLAGKGEPFTAVELVGFTVKHDVVYRTAVCDPDALGGRGPFCTAEVCVATSATPSADGSCEMIVDETADDETTGDKNSHFDLAAARDAIHRAEASRGPTTRGHAEAASLVSVMTKDGALSAAAPTWFGATRWTVLPARTDPETDVPLGYSNAAISSVQSSDDGACLGFTGTVLGLARYESVVANMREVFAARRCRD